jgi:hypothetical protein
MMCIGYLRIRILCNKCFMKIELEKLTNSKRGTKLSVFMKSSISFLWFAITIGEMSSP